MLNKIFLSIFFLCFNLPIWALNTISDDARKIEELIRHKVLEDKLGVGAAVALIDGDNIEYVYVGSKSKNSDQAVDSDTLFEIGSITKTFTAMALASLVVEGKVKLTDPVQNYLPKSVSLPILNDKPITFLSLANHSSGLPRMPDNMAYSDYLLPLPDYSTELMYQSLNHTKLTHEVGEGIEYSNFAVGLLGHVLSLIDHKSYLQMIHDRVLSPLNMRNTFVDLPDSQQKYLSDGHDRFLNIQKHFNKSLAGAGAIKSSITDMARYIQANISHQTLGKEFLLAQTPSIKLRMDNSEFGLNWFITTINNASYINHGGDTPGFHSFAGFDPEDKKGIVILSNSTLNLDYIAWAYLTDEIESVKTSADFINPKAQELEQLAGQYQLASGRVLTVTNKNNTLYIKSDRSYRVLFSAITNRSFVNQDRNIKIIFHQDEHGIIDSLDLNQQGDVQRCHKIGVQNRKD